MTYLKPNYLLYKYHTPEFPFSKQQLDIWKKKRNKDYYILKQLMFIFYSIKLIFKKAISKPYNVLTGQKKIKNTHILPKIYIQHLKQLDIQTNRFQLVYQFSG